MVDDTAVLLALLLESRPVELPPAVAGGVEALGGAADHVADPVLVPPGRVPDVVDLLGEDAFRAGGGTAAGSVVGELVQQVGQDVECRVVTRDIEDLPIRECRDAPVSASQTAWTWERSRSSLVRSRRGGSTLPATIRSERRK